MRRFVLAVAVFVALALVGALTPACDGDNGAPSPTPSDAELYQLLSELPAQAVLSLTFPGVSFQPILSNEPPLTFAVPAHPGARLEVVGALTGHLTQLDRPELATFVDLSEGDNSAEPEAALGLEAGLHMILVSIDRGQPIPAGVATLDASAQEFLEFAQAQKEGRLPFHQGIDNPVANGILRPAVASDVDNDGLDELVLLDSGVNQGVQAAVYLTFDWTGPGLRWTRIDPDGDGAGVPSKAVLSYLAAIEAAGGTAEAWDGTPRALAWEWLTSTPIGPISPDLLAQLAPADDPDGQNTARGKLQGTRGQLEAAYGLLSADWQQRQPWADFVYGFRNSTGVRLEKLLPPRQEESHTLVEVIITAISREGSVPVDRRFRVVYTVVEEAASWRLNGVDAREESPSSLP
jgi:hypothetical protein